MSPAGNMYVSRDNCTDIFHLYSIKWRHNGRDDVSNYQPHIVFSTVYSGADQRKHQSSASLAFVRGIHRGPVNSPHKWPVTRKMFPFDDVIMFYLMQLKYIPRTIIALLCFVVVWCPTGSETIVRVGFYGGLSAIEATVNEINTYMTWIYREWITKHSTAQPCAYFMGYVVQFFLTSIKWSSQLAEQNDWITAIRHWFVTTIVAIWTDNGKLSGRGVPSIHPYPF